MGQGPKGEERQGKSLLTLAAEAGVRHFVQCSAAGVERDSGVPHFESKRAIEHHIATVGLPATVLRPAAFMENFQVFAFRATMLSMMKTYLAKGQPMQMASARDVGWFVAEAFEKPEKYVGQAIEIAGDVLTWEEASRTLRHAGLRPSGAFIIPRFLRAKLPEDFRLMFE